MENIDEIRAKADELLKQSKYSEALPLYEQAAERGDIYSVIKAATIGSVEAQIDIAVFEEFASAEQKATQALHWYESFKDIDSPAISAIFDDAAFLRRLGFCYYRLAVHYRDEEKENNLLYQCFSLLCEVVDISDEHPDTQGLWALTVQRMQDLNWDISSEAVARKNELYEELISVKKAALCACNNYDSILSKIYVDYGFVLLEGTEVSADHTKAYHCFQNAFAMGIQSAEGILKQFEEIRPGTYIFVGE